MTDYHRQCDLVKGNDRTTTWIPEMFAKVGKTLKLQDGDGWDEGWVVSSVGVRLESSKVKDNSRDYLRQRKASDI